MSETTTGLTAEPVTETIEQRFTRETANHQLEILHDDGLYRHLSFREPGTGVYWFELITTPGSLTFQGDGTAFTFRRLRDMFEFFRDSSHPPKYRINPYYWAEKVVSQHARGYQCLQEYSEELFNELVAEALKEAEEEHPGVTATWKLATDDGVWSTYDTTTEQGAREALSQFTFERLTTTCTCGMSAEHDDTSEAVVWKVRHQRNYRADSRAHSVATEHGKTFQFTDTWEWDLCDWSWWYLWACHAIVWGISQYDTEHARRREAAVRAEAALAANSTST